MGGGPCQVRRPPANGFSQRWILTLRTPTSGCDVEGSPGAGAAKAQRMTWRRRPAPIPSVPRAAQGAGRLWWCQGRLARLLRARVLAPFAAALRRRQRTVP